MSDIEKTIDETLIHWDSWETALEEEDYELAKTHIEEVIAILSPWQVDDNLNSEMREILFMAYSDYGYLWQLEEVLYSAIKSYDMAIRILEDIRTFDSPILMTYEACDEAMSDLRSEIFDIIHSICDFSEFFPIMNAFKDEGHSFADYVNGLDSINWFELIAELCFSASVEFDELLSQGHSPPDWVSYCGELLEALKECRSEETLTDEMKEISSVAHLHAGLEIESQKFPILEGKGTPVKIESGGDDKKDKFAGIEEIFKEESRCLSMRDHYNAALTIMEQDDGTQESGPIANYVLTELHKAYFRCPEKYRTVFESSHWQERVLSRKFLAG